MSNVRIHVGRGLHQIATAYPTLFEVVMEQVQNGIDAGASYISVSINKKTRHLSVKDNGDGVTEKQFEEALASICESQKEAGKLGRFGIGLVSPLGKCESFSFISRSRSDTSYREWNFRCNAIKEMAEVKVPSHVRNDLFFRNGSGKGTLPKGVSPVDWKTSVSIVKYTEDRVISQIKSAQSVLDGIVSRFNAVMHRNKVVVGVFITNEDGTLDRASGSASRFTGRKLAEYAVQTKKAGKVVFRLFLARNTEKGLVGKIHMGELDNDYRFPVTNFVRATGKVLNEDVLTALTSGIFEGEILAEKATLHSNRKNFEKNEAFLDVAAAADEWFKAVGKKHVKEAEEQKQGQWLQQITLKSAKNIEGLLKDERLKHLFKDVLESFKRGTVGVGHYGPKPGAVVGKQTDKSLSTLAVQGKNGSGSSGEGGERESGAPESDIPSHNPTTVTGPEGTRRTVVRSDSLGLQFSHAPLSESGPLCKLDSATGTLFFNLDHPDWKAAAEAGDRPVMQLQEFAAVQALVMHAMPEDYRPVAELLSAEMVAPMNYLLLQSGSFNLRARIANAK